MNDPESTPSPPPQPGGCPAGRNYAPDVPSARYRCAACGNLTRFDVTLTRRSRRFHHYTVGGALTVEDEEVLSEVIE